MTARDAAHALLKALREPWACSGDEHSPRCDLTAEAFVLFEIGNSRKLLTLAERKAIYGEDS